MFYSSGAQCAPDSAESRRTNHFFHCFRTKKTNCTVGVITPSELTQQSEEKSGEVQHTNTKQARQGV